MSCNVFWCVLTALVVSGFMFAAPPDGQEPPKHSGVIVNVAPDAHTITVEEMGPWTGPDTIPQRQTVKLTIHTRIELTSRSESAPDRWGLAGRLHGVAAQGD